MAFRVQENAMKDIESIEYCNGKFNEHARACTTTGNQKWCTYAKNVEEPASAVNANGV